jgi:hypothetical protein
VPSNRVRSCVIVLSLEVPDSAGVGWNLEYHQTDPDMGDLVRVASVMYPISDTPVVTSLGWTRSPPWRYANASEGNVMLPKFFKNLGVRVTRYKLHLH